MSRADAIKDAEQKATADRGLRRRARGLDRGRRRRGRAARLSSRQCDARARQGGRRPRMSRDAFRPTESDLLPLSLGAALLGTGGGGNPYIGMLRLRELLRRGATSRCCRWRRSTTTIMSARSAASARRSSASRRSKKGEECLRALRGVEEAAGVKVSALISAEIGGSNSIEPMLTAAKAGLPVVDGDGMGRAFPEVQMSTFFIYGLEASPGAIADDKGNVVVFQKIIDMYWLERFARHVAVDMGARRGLRDDADAGRLCQKSRGARHADAGLNVGRVILDARAKRQDVVERV